METTLIQANRYAAAGFSVIPVFQADDAHQSRRKTPTRPWKDYQSRIANDTERSQMFINGAGIAVVCGLVSGHLEVIDFDDPTLFDPFLRVVMVHDSALAGKLTVHQETPSSGCHLLYRCTDPIEGNQKLAMSADGKDVLIETRGTGGYFLIEPSRGYHLHGDLAYLPTITKRERDLLLWIGRTFNRRPQQAEVPKRETTGDRPGDIFNHRADWFELLEFDGWRYMQTAGERHHYTRPGKSDGTSATLHPKMGLFIFSTSTTLPSEKPLDKFGYLAWSRFNGDFKEAARHVRGLYPEEFVSDSGHSGHSGHSGQNGQNGHSGLSGNDSGQNSGQNDRGWGDIASDVREYINGHNGEIKFSQLYLDLGLSSRRDKKTANDAICYMVKSGELEKHPTKRGCYLPTEPGLEFMTPTIEKRAPLPLTFPLELHHHFNIMPGTVIVIGGATNSGKTIMGMEILRRWVGQLSGISAGLLHSASPTHFVRSVGGSPEPEEFDPRLAAIAQTGIRYLNCEMTNEELGTLLADMGSDGEMLKKNVQWVSRKHDFPRAVLTDGITICDYLQIHRDFYEVGEIIAQMADRVGAGILIVMIQKKSGESFPRGGEFALERARTALLLDSVTQDIKSCYLRKVKYPADASKHPERKEVEYRISEQLLIKPVSDLRWLDSKQRDRIYKEYIRNITL